MLEATISWQHLETPIDAVRNTQRLGAADPESASIRVFPDENGMFSDRAAPGAAVGPENTSIDPELQAVIARWADLPDAVKAGIVAMVGRRSESRIKT